MTDILDALIDMAANLRAEGQTGRAELLDAVAVEYARLAKIEAEAKLSVKAFDEIALGFIRSKEMRRIALLWGKRLASLLEPPQ